MPWSDQEIIGRAIDKGFPDEWDREVILGVNYERDQMIEKGKPEWSLNGYLGLVKKRLLVNPHHYSKIIEKEKRKKSHNKEVIMEPEEAARVRKSYKIPAKKKAVAPPAPSEASEYARYGVATGTKQKKLPRTAYSKLDKRGLFQLAQDRSIIPYNAEYKNFTRERLLNVLGVKKRVIITNREALVARARAMGLARKGKRKEGSKAAEREKSKAEFERRISKGDYNQLAYAMFLEEKRVPWTKIYSQSERGGYAGLSKEKKAAFRRKGLSLFRMWKEQGKVPVFKD
jgi:hypothetical protein